MFAIRPTAWLRPAVTLLATVAVLALSACGGGSGAPNNPYQPTPTPPGPLVVVPAEATAHAGTPLILSISGGTPPYQAFSGNPAALPVPTSVSGNTLTLLANNVDSAQAANVTIRDAAGQTAIAEITVQPALLLPASMEITPNSAPCPGGDVCSGQTSVAVVSVRGSAGTPLAGRQVRFDVVQGNFQLATTNPGSPLASTQTVVSDANGEARVIISVPPNTPTQIGLLRATELTTGSQVTSQFVIAQVTSGEGVLSVAPSGAVTINGPQQNVCSSGARVNFYIFGGTPPYRVVTNFPDVVTLQGTPVTTNGGGFQIITNGTCFVGLTFAITDATGRTLTTGLPTVDNVPGTLAPTPPPAPAALQIAPTAIRVAPDCSGRTVQFVVSGGTPPYSAQLALNPRVSNPVITQSGSTFTVSFPAAGSGDPVQQGIGTFVVTDSTTPQGSVSATITCQ